jgi:hypothetical protein
VEIAMDVRRLAYAGTLAGAALILTIPSLQAEPRAVIELFTSQGCSSCPPADKLLAQFAKDPSLVPLTLAVDYWDYLGWKDTLALPGHTKRQQAYSKVRGDREVFTPQIVINGVVHVLGSDRAAIEQAITTTRKNTATLSLDVKLTAAADKVTVHVPAGAADARGEVWVCPVTHKVEIPIERGENRGQTGTYTNVVRRWIKIGDWTGKAESFNIPVKELTPREDTAQTKIDSVAVFVQSGVHARPGVMLGAAFTALNAAAPMR